MRITAGYARSILLDAPRGDATRPATDAARLAVFSSLGDIPENADVLDIFAGTGAYGLEAASRGAKSAVFVEKSPAAFAFLKRNIARVQKLVPAKLSAALSDCFKCKHALSDSAFDLIFADPPYALLSNADFQKSLFELFGRVARENAYIILEAPAEFEPDAPEGFKLAKRLGKKSKGKPSQLIFLYVGKGRQSAFFTYS